MTTPNRTISLPCFSIVIEVNEAGGGHITSDLEGIDAVDAIESLILAHACAGVDVEDPAYIEGIEVAVDAVTNHVSLQQSLNTEDLDVIFSALIELESQMGEATEVRKKFQSFDRYGPEWKELGE